jgi:hypothetical protein
MAQRRILQHAARLRRLRPEFPSLLASLSAANTVCASRPGPATCSQRRLARRVVLDRRVLGDRSDDPCDAIPKKRCLMSSTPATAFSTASCSPAMTITSSQPRPLKLGDDARRSSVRVV